MGSDAEFFEPRPGQTQWWVGDPNAFPATRYLADHPSLAQRRKVLSPEQCDALIACFERNRPLHAARTGSAFWDDRYIWQNNIPSTEVDALRIMQQVRLIAQVTATQEFQPSKPLYSETAQLVLWTEGIELTPHADNMHPNGQPNGTPHRCYSTLIYLNDDFEGGETYFPGFGIRVRPERGSLILYGSGPEYVHGVTKVTRGRRYTCAGWFTYDPLLEDRNARVAY